MQWWGPGPPEDLPAGEIAERLRWLLKLRWLVVPVFIGVSAISDLVLAHRAMPWTALGLGGALLAANAVYALLLSRHETSPWLLRWARLEAYLIVTAPVVLAATGQDSGDGALRFGVLVGVVGAAAVLPRRGDVARVALWAMVALFLGDALGARFDPARFPPSHLVHLVIEAVIIGTVATIASHLQFSREWASLRARAAHDTLERARAEWEAVFDDLAEVVIVTDAEGRVVRANRAFAKLTGIPVREASHRPLREVLAGHPERWWLPVDGIVEVEDPVFDGLFEVSSTRLGDRVVRVARDVGEQRRLQARIVQADKLAAVGLLASNVAHELNNPSAFVTSNLSELQRYIGAYESALTAYSALALEAGVAERVRVLLARPEVAFARREAPNAVAESLAGMERVRQIVTNLRSLARPDPAGEGPVPVELGEVIQAVVRTAALDLRSASAQVDVPSSLWVLGHRGEIVDVVLNLVVNAIQARAEGRPNRISVTLRREGASAVLRVSDTGKGISAAHMKRLFEPFFTTKALGEGTGLGLSLARKIIIGHHGAIDVTSEAGVGSIFTVRLPALDVAAPAERTRAESGAA